MMDRCKLLAAMALLLGLCCALAGCKRSNIATNFSGTIADWQADADPKKPAEPSNIVAFTTPAFGGETGFDVVAWPDSDALRPELMFAVDGWFAQMEYYTAGGQLLVVRVANAEDRRLSTTYTETHGTEDDALLVDDIEVGRRSGGEGCQLATWQRGDFQYLVHSNHQWGAIPTDALEALVRGLDSRLAEGAASAAGAPVAQ